jgi:hypothetical protein
VDCGEIQFTRIVWTGIIGLLASLGARDDDDDCRIHALFRNEQSKSIIEKDPSSQRTERKSMTRLTVYEPEPGRRLNAINKNNIWG